MKKRDLCQSEIDKMVFVDRVPVDPSVFSVGCLDVDFRVWHDGIGLWQYETWKGVLQRSCGDVFKDKYPTYRDVTVCEEWLSFATFLEWVNREVGYKGKPVGLDLDKDLMVRGNKIYSPEFCSFVPKEVNILLTNKPNHRGEWPLGVCFDKKQKKFRAYLSKYGKAANMKRVGTAEEAFLMYKVGKEQHIKEIAEMYREQLNPKVFETLMNWEVTPY